MPRPAFALRWITAADIVAQQALLLRHPDFVVADEGQYWQVSVKSVRL